MTEQSLIYFLFSIYIYLELCCEMNSVQLALSPFDIFVFYMVAGIGIYFTLINRKNI